MDNNISSAFSRSLYEYTRMITTQSTFSYMMYSFLLSEHIENFILYLENMVVVATNFEIMHDL